MRPPKTDRIIEISIKKYVDYEKKIDTRNYRNNTSLALWRLSAFKFDYFNV